MDKQLITEEVVRVKVKCENWKQAIHEGADLLVKSGAITNEYENAILDNFKELGPYMVIAPRIVLSHARPENGVNNTAMSMITLETPIEFGSDLNDPVTLVVTLAASDNSSHMETLAKLMELFMNAEDMDKIFEASSKEQLLEVINKYKI